MRAAQRLFFVLSNPCLFLHSNMSWFPWESLQRTFHPQSVLTSWLLFSGLILLLQFLWVPFPVYRAVVAHLVFVGLWTVFVVFFLFVYLWPFLCLLKINSREGRGGAEVENLPLQSSQATKKPPPLDSFGSKRGGKKVPPFDSFGSKRGEKTPPLGSFSSKRGGKKHHHSTVFVVSERGGKNNTSRQFW